MQDKRYVQKTAACRRLKQDVAVLVTALVHAEQKRAQETRIVVTYGCPDDQLATTVKHNDPFRGVAHLGGQPVYKYLEGHVDYWIYGAKGDDFRSSMCNGKIVTLSNIYTAINHLNGDGFGVNFKDSLTIKRKYAE